MVSWQQTHSEACTMISDIRSCLALVAALLLAPASATAQDATLTPAQARALARDAYVFTYPLVMNYRTMYMQAIQGDGRFGPWLHLGLSSPADTAIATPQPRTAHTKQRHPALLRLGGPARRAVGADHPHDRPEAALHQPVG